ncbi:MAG: hypothetical protein JGK17_06845 [Microcoleus sp. PH2017_10_PVI_O_A]|uniref:hypothetical protein n=1 Tax=unclassified Microcoleus TaxID=2642155 RepID=UPI001E1A3205|nr:MULTISPECIES: hypothetical protein [unclassified Microcoleus]TAE83310.1 MAG: hypothetical protein EAZ83_09410 [Oscillatoriales cyanobacterium]MCC3405302.1 hypothetical protein [Microcoleus sp. PH2017_10_PVI_O_A]MCC3460415.1 hypothetical protein [Microcoleus sp. PH2017_11_PCY_U_A]MCC3478701.1 hypothetical protein [Microcoleus sp. PH2017_12_PCY_D_A]MCC3528372.1 hypothetical protein [Microcoleus sp. PH2017_21_RUC_O_A]
MNIARLGKFGTSLIFPRTVAIGQISDRAFCLKKAIALAFFLLIIALLSVDRRNFVADFDIKFIYEGCDRQKSAASLGSTDKKSPVVRASVLQVHLRC